jgi:shikimate dehydrogenase
MKKINPDTKIFTILANPIKQVITPNLFNKIFNYLSINAVYIPTHILSDKGLKGFFDFIRYSSNYIGLNLSIPYKSVAIKYLDILDNNAKNIGAVNTLFVDCGKIIGYNTDGIGYLEALKHEKKFKISNKSIMIMGAGGASRAITFSLIKEHPKELIIVNRNKKKAKRIKDIFYPYYNNINIFTYNEINKRNLKDIDLLINTTSVGLKKNDPLLIDIDLFSDDVIISDIIMNPIETKLIKEAKKKSKNFFTGDNMLIYQINHMLNIWNIETIDIDLIRRWFPNIDKQ